jgi:hypothetical protein
MLSNFLTLNGKTAFFYLAAVGFYPSRNNLLDYL